MFQSALLFVGIVLILTSGFLGDWSAWLGVPFAFAGIILKFLDLG